MLAAGLEGIAKGADPGDPHTENMYLKSAEEVSQLGIKRLPQTLGEALEAFAADPLARSVFGPSMFTAWLDYKRDEWISYLNHVSDWERARYLKFF